MNTRGTLGTTLFGFACFAAALAATARTAEKGVEKVTAVRSAVEAGADVATALSEAGAPEEFMEAIEPMAQAAPALGLGVLAAEREDDEDDGPRQTGPWPPFVDPEPVPLPRNLRVQLVDGASAVQAFERVTVTQCSGGVTHETRAYRLSEEDPTLWAIGSPGLFAGDDAQFDVRAEAGARVLVGSFTLEDVPAGVEVSVGAPVPLAEVGR